MSVEDGKSISISVSEKTHRRSLSASDYCWQNIQLLKYYQKAVISLEPRPGHEVVRQNIDDIVHEQMKGRLIILPICISLSE
jgi:hypothetical protein